MNRCAIPGIGTGGVFSRMLSLGVRVFALAVLLSPVLLMAEASRNLVARGNAAYRAGSFDEALARYEEASVDSPESATLYFNKGAALYQKEDYAAAVQAFEQAALKSRKPRLGSLSKFGLGNCAFREAERQRDSDLKKALEACEKSIRHYQEALELAPDYTEAAENIEVVRLVMKSILDEINKKQEEQQKQQDAMEEIVKKLKELIARQTGAVEQNDTVSTQEKQVGNTQAVRDQIQELGLNQKSIQSDSSGLSSEMMQMEAQMQAQQHPHQAGQPPMPPEESPLTKARHHVDTAVADQGSSIEKLSQDQLKSAKPYQEKALEELKEALAKLSEGQDQQEKEQQKQDQQGDQDDQEPREGDDSEKDSQDKDQKDEQSKQDSKPDPGQKQEPPREPDPKEAKQARAKEEARNILDEEKENRDRRQVRSPAGFRPVDRDW
jgi:tetratricopeptide (TPR) repeat protein